MRGIDNVRKSSGEWENHLIDEFLAGRLTRRELLRRGAVLGMSLPILSFIASCGGASTGSNSSPGTGQPKSGGKIVVGSIAPGEKLDPLFASSHAAQVIFGSVGDFLAWSNENLELEPRIAESWKPNADSSVWTFQIRQGIKFHDGSQLTAKDVAASFNRLSDPAMKSNSLSAFKGVLDASGVSATGDYTVQFQLKGPNGNFPYLVSSDNYNAIVQPAQQPADWERTFIGTGPWKLSNYQPNVSLTLSRNSNYWRQPAFADSLEIRFFDGVSSEIIAIQAGDVQVAMNLPATSQIDAVVRDPNIRLIETRSAQHPEIHMLTDKEPFNDKRVRKALALALNRQELVSGLINKRGDLGNDNPFAPVYPSTYKDVSQRQQDIQQAKQLLSAAGKSNGISFTVYTPKVDEMPDLVVLLQNAAKAIGMNLTPQVVEEAKYYDQYWLGNPISATKYLHRGVPNVYLTATLTTNGPWNAGHYSNPDYDAAVKEYVGSSDLQAQLAASKKIQTILLDDVPVVIPYFTHSLVAARNAIVGTIRTTATTQLDVTRAGFAG